MPEEKKVIELDRVILAAEREEIAAWAAQGIKRLKQNNQYTLPMSHLALSDQVANYSNSVRMFLKDCGGSAFRGGSEITETALYNAYYTFCVTTQTAKPVMQKKFQEMLRQLENAFKVSFFVDRVNDRDITKWKE